jgi:type IV secretory pathway TrbL component
MRRFKDSIGNKGRMKKLLFFILNYVVLIWLFFGGIPIYLGFLAGKPIYGIIAAIFLILGAYGTLLKGALNGAEYTL